MSYTKSNHVNEIFVGGGRTPKAKNNGGTKMNNYLKDIFKRDVSFTSLREVFSWWEKGRGLLNLILVLYLLIYFVFYIFILNDGFILLLLPNIFYNLVLMNFLFLFGFFLELILKTIKIKANYIPLSESIKVCQIIFIITIFIVLSIFSFPSEWMLNLISRSSNSA